MPHLPIALPEPGLRFSQDDEWCVARIDGAWRELRFHDYSRLYEVEGLYERLFYDILKCESPFTVRRILASVLASEQVPPQMLRVLDLGAGNGIMGQELVRMGVEKVVGVDILSEAATAAQRDRPGIYADYIVVDLCDPPPDERARLAAQRFNCLTCVAALGFGDIPPRAFREAFNVVVDGGWIAFTLKEEFLNGSDSSGFARLVEAAVQEGLLELREQRRYRHRLSTAGEPLHYVAMVGRKTRDMPEAILR
jgi:SAM-dependent methyltransferase